MDNNQFSIEAWKYMCITLTILGAMFFIFKIGVALNNPATNNVSEKTCVDQVIGNIVVGTSKCSVGSIAEIITPTAGHDVALLVCHCKNTLTDAAIPDEASDSAK